MGRIHYLKKFLSFVPKIILLSQIWMNFTNLDHDESLRYEKFTSLSCGALLSVIDMQLQELNSHFNEVSSKLLLCVAYLSLDNLFASFNKEKLLRFAHFYPNDFSTVKLSTLDNQLETYILDIRFSDKFATLKGIGQLAEKLVKMKRDVIYPLVYTFIIDSASCDSDY
jgi:hypothetical protein